MFMFGAVGPDGTKIAGKHSIRKIEDEEVVNLDDAEEEQDQERAADEEEEEEEVDCDNCGSNCSPWVVTGFSVPFMVTLFGAWLAAFFPQFGVVEVGAGMVTIPYALLVFYCIAIYVAISVLQLAMLPPFGKFKHPEDMYGYASYIAPRLNTLFAISAYTQPVLVFATLYLAEINPIWGFCVAITIASNDVLIVMITRGGKVAMDGASRWLPALIACQFIPFLVESMMLIYIPLGPNVPRGADFVHSKQVLSVLVVIDVTLLHLLAAVGPAFVLLFTVKNGTCHEDGADDTKASVAASIKYTKRTLNIINGVNALSTCGAMVCVSLIHMAQKHE